jgi:hypothetical protein
MTSKPSHLAVVRERAVIDLSEPASAADASLEEKIPFCIRITLEQILAVAEDAELRAQFLARTVNRIPAGTHDGHRTESLLGIAADLRRVAAQLENDWVSHRSSH